MNFILRLLITAAVAFGLTFILKGVHIDTYVTALVFALILAIMNAIVKPLLILLTLPITIITLGLFLLVINGLVIILASKFVHGVRVDGILWAIVFSLLLTFLTSVLLKSFENQKY